MPIQPSDLFLSPDLTEEQAQHYLRSLGLRDPALADRRLQAMAEDLGVRLALGEMAPALVDALKRVPDADAALVGLSDYLGTRASKVTFLNHLRDDPKALDVLLHLFSLSRPLGEMLLRDPEQFPWLIARIDRRPARTIDDEELDAAHASGRAVDLEGLMRLFRRHALRIGARAAMGRETADTAAAQLSHLSELMAVHLVDVASREALTLELEEVRALVEQRLG